MANLSRLTPSFWGFSVGLCGVAREIPLAWSLRNAVRFQSSGKEN